MNVEPLGLFALVALLLVKEMGLPVPIPGDLVVIGAGIAASRGAFDPVTGLVLIVLAGIAGGIVQFLLIRGAGRRILLGLLDRVGVGADRMDPAADRLRPGVPPVSRSPARPRASGSSRSLPAPSRRCRSPRSPRASRSATRRSSPRISRSASSPASRPFRSRRRCWARRPSACSRSPVLGALGWALIARRRRRALPPLAAWTDAACPACLAIGVLRADAGTVAAGTGREIASS